MKIHDDVTIPHYVMEHWDVYGDSVALVGIERKLSKTLLKAKIGFFSFSLLHTL